MERTEDKKKYSIGEVGKITGIPTSTLRFYEKEGLLPQVQRDKNGIRSYSEEDLFWVEMIKCLRDTNMGIEDIKNIVSLSEMGEITELERKNIFLKHREKVLDEIKQLEKYIEKIDLKIKWYEDKGTDCKK
ncbi:MAG: MerR family transcriptional regulator [Fusobacteriaceae bacterium]